MSKSWLRDYLDKAVAERLCTKPWCTTCGATPFRKGLLAALGQVSETSVGRWLDEPSGREILVGLAHVTNPAGPKAAAIEEAVRFVIFELWRATWLSVPDMRPQLEGTYAGDVLQRMEAHHEAVEAARVAAQRRSDPELARERREQKKRERQAAHTERIALQRERSREWHEAHPGSQDPRGPD